MFTSCSGVTSLSRAELREEDITHTRRVTTSGVELLSMSTFCHPSCRCLLSASRHVRRTPKQTESLDALVSHLLCLNVSENSSPLNLPLLFLLCCFFIFVLHSDVSFFTLLRLLLPSVFNLTPASAAFDFQIEN